jgi:hypothetical protein
MNTGALLYTENLFCIFSTREADGMRIMGPAVGTHASAAEVLGTKFCPQTDCSVAFTWLQAVPRGQSVDGTIKPFHHCLLPHNQSTPPTGAL